MQETILSPEGFIYEPLKGSSSMVDLLGAMMYCNFILMYFDLWLFIGFLKKYLFKDISECRPFSKKETLFSKPYSLVNSNLRKE